MATVIAVETMAKDGNSGCSTKAYLHANFIVVDASVI
jgi:hypothetical protein